MVGLNVSEGWRPKNLRCRPGEAGSDADAWFGGAAVSPRAGGTLPAVTILFPRIDAEKLAEG